MEDMAHAAHPWFRMIAQFDFYVAAPLRDQKSCGQRFATDTGKLRSS
jgi:hypothetical protein